MIINEKTIKPDYFTLTELIRTDTGINNMPCQSLVLSNIARLWYILNCLRDEFGSAIIINSAYRSPQVNKAVGGVPNSLHMQGRAADIRTLPHLMDDLRLFLNGVREKHPNLFVEFIDNKTFFHIAI